MRTMAPQITSNVYVCASICLGHHLIKRHSLHCLMPSGINSLPGQCWLRFMSPYVVTRLQSVNHIYIYVYSISQELYSLVTLCCVLLWFGIGQFYSYPSYQDYLTGIGATIQLSRRQCGWSNPENMGKPQKFAADCSSQQNTTNQNHVLIFYGKYCIHISMGQCKKDVTPLLMHWSYIFLALTHRYIVFARWNCIITRWYLSTILTIGTTKRAREVDVYNVFGYFIVQSVFFVIAVLRVISCHKKVL